MDSNAIHGNPGQQTALGETQRSTEGPTAQEWQRVKEDIRELYARMALKDVRAVLESRYGFKATYVLPATFHAFD
jgi:hypothetical protein